MSYREITTDVPGHMAAMMLFAAANTPYTPSDRDTEAIHALQACDACGDSICMDHGDDVEHLADTLNDLLGDMEPPNGR